MLLFKLFSIKVGRLTIKIGAVDKLYCKSGSKVSVKLLSASIVELEKDSETELRAGVYWGLEVDVELLDGYPLVSLQKIVQSLPPK